MNKQYARTDYEGREYITAGKLYPIHWRGCRFFKIISDSGNVISPHFKNSIHIDDNDWEIIDVEESETMNVLTAKQGMQTAVMDWAEEMRSRGWWVEVTYIDGERKYGADCGKIGKTHGLVGETGKTELEARIALMKRWDARFGEAAVLDREWKAFVSGLPDGVEVWRYEDDGRHHAVVVGEKGGHILKVAGKDEAATKRGLMAAWAAING